MRELSLTCHPTQLGHYGGGRSIGAIVVTRAMLLCFINCHFIIIIIIIIDCRLFYEHLNLVIWVPGGQIYIVHIVFGYVYKRTVVVYVYVGAYCLFVTVTVRTPTMSGGMYVISRSFFNDLGGYDTGMDMWGAENLEISFRVSMQFITWHCLVSKTRVVPPEYLWQSHPTPI